jgi:hypothetical protein
MRDFGVIFERVPLMCDDTSAISVAKNLVFHKKMRHVERRHHFLRDHVEKGDIETRYIDSSGSDEDEKPKCKIDDFIDLCLMSKSSRHISDSDSNVSDDLYPKSLYLRVVELENALSNQDKLLCKVFRENKKLNLEVESDASKIATL